MPLVIAAISISAFPSGAADLVSCGGSGTVRLWSTQHARLVGQFTAHEGDLGSIVIAVSPCGEYLTTADREGTVKIWDVKVGLCTILYIMVLKKRSKKEKMTETDENRARGWDRDQEADFNRQ